MNIPSVLEIDRISFKDYLAINNLAFLWATYYDLKDWNKLKECFAPLSSLDLSLFRGEEHIGLTPDQHVSRLKDDMSEERLFTQHLLSGVSAWRLLTKGVVQVYYKIRIAHERYKDDQGAELESKGYAHGHLTIWYYHQKEGDSWKIGRVVPAWYWPGSCDDGTLRPPEERSRGERLRLRTTECFASMHMPAIWRIPEKDLKKDPNDKQ